jgi:hypothetical protein
VTWTRWLRAAASQSGIQALLEPNYPDDLASVAWQHLFGQTHTATVVLATGPADGRVPGSG